MHKSPMVLRSEDAIRKAQRRAWLKENTDIFLLLGIVAALTYFAFITLPVWGN